ncbi:MAG: penicillin-insensitive murein endopeptidase [Byssovorax sp.]
MPPRSSLLSRLVLAALLLAFASLATACATPTPLAPAIRGSIGLPHHGMISNAVRIPKKGPGYAMLRQNDRDWGNPRLVAAIQHAAREVAEMRPGGPRLMVGDISPRWGGESSGHHSHRTGRDADLLIYTTTPAGVPIVSPGFLRFGPDGLAQGDGKKGKLYRMDVEREWLLIKALIRSPEAHVQWLFFARWLEALVIEYARARGEDPELIWYAESVLLQPGDSLSHDDHLHLRLACTPDEAIAGCLSGGPNWPWLPALPQLATPPDAELARTLIDDLLPAAQPSSAPAAP